MRCTSVHGEIVLGTLSLSLPIDYQQIFAVCCAWVFTAEYHELAVAQPSEGRGRKFESCRARQQQMVYSGHIVYTLYRTHR